MADALIKGGLSCAEVTFRTEAAEESIRFMSEGHSEMNVGAGTVLGIEHVDSAVNYGVAHGVLAITTPGDTTMANLKEVESIMGGKGTRVQR